MARIHARRRGDSGSVRPHRSEAPAWSNTDVKAIEKVIVDLKKEVTRAVRSALSSVTSTEFPMSAGHGKTDRPDHKGERPAVRDTEDLRNLMMKALGLRKHIVENRKRPAQPSGSCSMTGRKSAGW